MTADNRPARLEIFRSIRVNPDGEREIPLGNLLARDGESVGETGRRVTIVRVAGTNARLRGPKVVEIKVEGLIMSSKTVSLGRKSGKGYQTVGTGDRIGIRISNL